MDSVAGLGLNGASDGSFLSKGIRQPNLYADRAKLLQFLGSTSSAPALFPGRWRKGRPCFPGLLRGNFLMPPARDCKALGMAANKQKVFGKAPWHFWGLFPPPRPASFCTRCFTAFESPYRCWFLACGVLEAAGGC